MEQSLQSHLKQQRDLELRLCTAKHEMQAERALRDTVVKHHERTELELNKSRADTAATISTLEIAQMALSRARAHSGSIQSAERPVIDPQDE